ncbi:MAG: hypothetical protein KA175_07160 [Flavobacteriales bacterium]|nr:hypothetical protein [Flavobacteriales bacterium]MBP6697378.1 hypothetical protein [Flavobacteriales bacterium]
MKNPILPIMLTAFAPPLLAQGSMIPTNNWLAAHQQTIGATTPANWLQDLDAEDLEVYVTTENALVLVDRAPIIEEDGAAYLRKGVHGLGGTHLSLVGEVEIINEHVLHGVYSGLIGGTAVLMDQYVHLRNGVPITIVRMVSRVNGSAPADNAGQEQLALELIRVPENNSEPALTNN